MDNMLTHAAATPLDNTTIPFGLCQCGCGQKTDIALKNRPERRHIKGQPFRFIYLHRIRYKPPVIEQPENTSIRHIPLTHGKVAIVDAGDFDWINQWKWRCVKSLNVWYAIRSRWKAEKMEDENIFMHRVIMQPKGNLRVDHIDRNGLNNSRSNLRLATFSQNACNRKIPKHNASGYKGVYWDKDSNKWRAEIRTKGKLFRLGKFHNIKDASAAYKEAAQKYHGEFARIE
jgi:hypothetical protein